MIFYGDGIAALERGKYDIDLLITDPPYNISKHYYDYPVVGKPGTMDRL